MDAITTSAMLNGFEQGLVTKPDRLVGRIPHRTIRPLSASREACRVRTSVSTEMRGKRDGGTVARRPAQKL